MLRETSYQLPSWLGGVKHPRHSERIGLPKLTARRQRGSVQRLHGRIELLIRVSERAQRNELWPSERYYAQIFWSVTKSLRINVNSVNNTKT